MLQSIIFVGAYPVHLSLEKHFHKGFAEIEVIELGKVELTGGSPVPALFQILGWAVELPRRRYRGEEEMPQTRGTFSS